MKLEVFKSSYGYYNLRTIDGKPTEEMSNYLKQNGYYWSSNNNCWYPHTSAAKQANETFVGTFRQKFFDPATQEQKSFGQELFEREQRKWAWREAHGLSPNLEHSEEKPSVDERITYLENLVKELQEERAKDKAKIANLESELLSKVDESVIDYELEQQQIDEYNEMPSEIILDSAEVMNTLGEIMEEATHEEEPQAENDFIESSVNEEDPEVEVSPEELSLAKSVLPTSQYVSTLRFSQGEEGNFFKQKIKEIAEVVNNAPKLYETDGAEQHPIILRYFHPTGTTSLVCEIGKDGQAYGFQCLNGNWEMAEWGGINLNETKNIPLMELDYHIPQGMTIERWLYQKQPDMFPQYAKFNAEFTADKVFNSVMNKSFDNNKIEHDAYDYAKSRFLDGSISDLKFGEVQKDFYKNTAASELNEILKESPDQEVARLAALRYFNAWADDGLWKENNNLYNLYGILGMSYQPKPAELNDFIKNTYNELHGIVEETKSLNENDTKDIKQNFVLEKLAAAGIEVVSSKAEFDNILKNHNILQKMETSSTEEKNPLFLADEKELKAFAQKVDDWKAGKLGQKDVIIELSTSTVLQAITIPANKVSINQTVLKKINLPETIKIGNSYGHDIDIGTIKQIPNFLADPIMVYKSASRNDSYTVLTEAVDKNNESILIALEINKSENGILVNNITSAYGKDENEWFIEQVKIGNLVYQDKKRSLEWSNRRRLLLPNQMTTQGSLNIIQKEDIVNKRTVNFDLNERKIEFTENQQHFLKSIGFENSLNEDGSLSKSSFFIKNTEGKKTFIKINLNVNNNTVIFVKNEEAVDDFLIYDNSHKYFFEFSMIAEANANEPLVPAEALGKVLSDYALDRLVSVDDELMEEKFINKPDSIFVEDNLKKQLEEISFKSKVVNLPAKYISEDIYSSGIQPIGKVLQFVIHDTVAKTAGLEIPKQKHYLLEIQTDNNYEYVHNKAYPRLYEAKWDRNSQSYIDVVELDLSNFDSKTIGNIQYISANNCNYPNPPAQTMTLSDGNTYGFAYEGKIYLNPDIWNSEVAVHEYTHLWDNYIQRTNLELWEKGKQIFRNTRFWNEVKNDPNYADIADNNDLILSEIHARICGELSEKVLNKILEQDGKLAADKAINWDNETWEYLFSDLGVTEFPITQSSDITFDEIRDFLSAPMKDLMNGLRITQNINIKNSPKPDNPQPIISPEVNEIEVINNPDEIQNTISKLETIIKETYLTIPEGEEALTHDELQRRYDKWTRPMAREILDELKNGNQNIIKLINDFDLNKENHLKEGTYGTAEQRFKHDVHYELMPALYKEVQNKIIEKYDENKTPYVILHWSESPVFSIENKVYTLKEFNELLTQADKEFHDRKEYAEKKYGSADNYWRLEDAGKLPDEDKGITFGYDKTEFKLYNIPNLENPEDTYSYEASRYDIGDGDGSVFDFIRTTCSHDVLIESCNKLEREMYYPEIEESQRVFVENAAKEEATLLKHNLVEKMEALDNAQQEYTELHKKWLIEASEAERIDEQINKALADIKATYDNSISNLYTKVLNEYPFAAKKNISDSQFMLYTANEAKKMVLSELYLPSLESAKDFTKYTSTDWDKFRKIFKQFPAKVNMTEYYENLLQEKCEEKGYSVYEHNEKVDVYIASTKIVYVSVIDKLSKEGFTISDSEYAEEPSYDELKDTFGTKSSPYIVLDNNSKAFKFVSKETLETNPDYKDKGINYLNENLELESLNVYSGLSAKSYYNSKGTREICHILKESNRTSEQYKNAVETVAKYFAEQGVFNGDCYIAPAPNHSGKAEYTYDIAREIALKTNAKLVDIFECEPHETLYDMKKNGEKPSINMHLNSAGVSLINYLSQKNVNLRPKVYFIDNNISTGLTFNTASKLYPELIPAPYAIGNFAEISMVNNRYVVNNLLEDNSVNEITADEFAQEKNLIQKKNIQQNFISFQYKGNTYIPFRAFKESSGLETYNNENEWIRILHNLDWNNATLKKENDKDYSVNSFYEAAGGKEKCKADIFYCINNSSFVLPTDGGIAKIDTENVDIDSAAFQYDAEVWYAEQFEKKQLESENSITVTPVTLEEILDVMEMRPEVTEDGKIKVFDIAREEYIGSNGIENEEDVFNNAAEIFERLEIYINDYFINDMKEQLEAGYVKLRGDETLEDLCTYAKGQLKAGITTVSQGELNLAMGIVNPDTVIMPELYQKKMQEEKSSFVFNHSLAGFPGVNKWKYEELTNDNGMKLVELTGLEYTAGQHIEKARVSDGKDGWKETEVLVDYSKVPKVIMSKEDFIERGFSDYIEKNLIDSYVLEKTEYKMTLQEASESQLKEAYDFVLENLGAAMENIRQEELAVSDKMTIENLTPKYNAIAEELGRRQANQQITTEPQQLTSKKDIKAIREQCREILQKSDSEITEAEKDILAQYEGAGGINEENRTNAGILNEFYTPNNLVEKVWQIVDAYAPNAKTVLEPSAGIGKFANNRPNNEFTMHELDETSARINRILHPEAKIMQGAYQRQFFDEGERFRKTDFVQPKYDVIIGNPPYGTYNDKFKGLGEGKEFDRYEEYFIAKGLEALKDENSVMAFVVPSGFLNTASDKQKELIASKGKLIDAYRLPVGTFPTTEVGTDIIILQSWEKDRKEINLNNHLVGVKAHAQFTNKLLKERQEESLKILSESVWFKQHPEKILGEVKTRSNRFGKEEEYVAVHEGLTVQDELNKIDSMLPKIEQEKQVLNKKRERLQKVLNAIEKEPYYNSHEEERLKIAKEFLNGIDNKDFELLNKTIDYGSGDTNKFKILFEELEHVHLSDDVAQRKIWLSEYANPETVPDYMKFQTWDEALYYAVNQGSPFENGRKRIFEFFKENSDTQERAKFLKNEYGEGGGGQTCYNKYYDAKGFKLDVVINGTEKSKEFSWAEVAKAISTEVMLGKYYQEEIKVATAFVPEISPALFKIYPDAKDKVITNEESVQDQPSLTLTDNIKQAEQITENYQSENLTGKKSIRPKKEKWNINKSKGEVMTAEEFSRLYGRDFDEREFPIWAATDWQGNIELNKLTDEQYQYMVENENYIQKDIGQWTHKVLFASGNIYAKIEEQKKLLEKAQGSEISKIFEHNIEVLESSKKPIIDIEHIHLSLKSTLSEEFTITHFDEEGDDVQLNLQESFILWATNQTLATQTWRGDIDFASANITREELGNEITFNDIVDYIDGTPVKADPVRSWKTYDMDELEIKALKAEKRKQADLKRQERSDVANKIFDRYLHEGLDSETAKRLETEYNRRFNSYVNPDYSKLPLFVDGMSAYKGDSKFKLYDQQIKGISFLCNKGNGLPAYDVGVGKTATGIVATKNQIQLNRSKRPIIIVPNKVYGKWYTDIKQLFPKVKVNELYNFNKKSVSNYIDKKNPHKLIIPENTITLVTYEALKHITFTDESCENELYEDFSNLLSEEMDGSKRENAQSSDKIKGTIGAASQVKDENYFFFEDCGFDNITVDEAHNFKNLWTIPRPKKKGESNEYAGIPSGRPSARALKLYAMTQLVQRHNNDRNVFLLTATPFVNSPTEVYSMLSYMGRKRLHETGIHSLRDFMNEFCETKMEFSVSPKGNVETRQVMKNWKELPALQNLLTEFIDKVDGEEAGIIRPVKFTHVKQLDMSELQKKMREIDEQRMAEIKEGNSAAIIVAMNNMRLACVAPALCNPDMYPGLELPPLSQLVETSPKLKFICDTFIDLYKKNPDKGQYMYVPLGKDSHGIIKDYLVKHGVPKEAVEIINGEVNNTQEKQDRITEKFNNPEDKLKIIIGGKNTCEGIDLNGNSMDMANCSLGWNPNEAIQAEGRVWRQGNLQGNVHAIYPVMNDSIDSVLYQKHDEKRSRINELWNYKGDKLNVEDINPEDLKFDLIKDPNKKAKLILEEETKDVKAELSKLNLKIKDFDEIIEKRKQLTLDFGTTEEDVQRYEKQIQDYKDRNLEVPEWIKLTLKKYKKDLEKQQYQKSNIQNKLYSWNLKTEEDEAAYIHNLNEQKKACEEKIHNIEKSLPEILQKLVVERMEQKIMEYPVTKQREILEADVLNNLRPMKEVEFEIKTDRHNKMLAEMLKAGDITQEEHDLYKAVGYEKYEKWLNGEIESLEEKPVQEVVKNNNQQSRVVEDNTSKVTDEYGFEVFGEETPDKQEEIKKAVEAIPSEQNNSEKMEKLKSATENAKIIVGANTISNDPSDLFFGFTDDDLFVKSPDNGKDELVVKSPEQLYFNFDNDDTYLSPVQLCKAEQERDKIVLPVLNDKESGMYKAFKDFAQHGVFDIIGTKIDMKETENGNRISPTGWKQLHAAMNIYRNKQFETFRYVLVDRHNGRIKDQLSVCSYMPNVCKVSDSEGKTLENVLTRAEETDCLIVAVHNHPSGNVQESNYDREATKSLEKSCLRNDGLQRFAGHIILDHDNFNIYKPHQGWKVHKDEQMLNVEDELINKDFAFSDTKIRYTGQLLDVAKSINETNNWNDNFVPVLFVNADCNISGLKYYDKSFFNKESQIIRNELQFSAIEAGAVNIFPVVTEALTNKLNGADRFLMEEKMKELVMQNILTDVVLSDSTIVEKNNLPDRHSLYENFIKLAKPDIKTTWEHKINPTLFEQLKMGTLKVIQDEELEKKPQQDLSHLKKAAGMGY